MEEDIECDPKDIVQQAIAFSTTPIPKALTQVDPAAQVALKTQKAKASFLTKQLDRIAWQMHNVVYAEQWAQ